MATGKKEAAKILFDSGWEQKRIAEMMKVSEVTLSKWATEGNWKKKLAQKSLSKEVAEDVVWELINYQLKALKQLKDKWEKEKKEDLKLLDRGDVDALQKLYTTVKGKQIEWAQVVTIIKEFIDDVQERDLDTAKRLLPFAESFLNRKRTDL
jgi:predicted transcriptional regulator